MKSELGVGIESLVFNVLSYKRFIVPILQLVQKGEKRNEKV